jgi:hypothetical protein
MRSTNCRALSAFSLLFVFAFSGAAHAQGESEICRSDGARFSARAPNVNQTGRREWVWEGRETLTIQGPLKLRYEAGGTPRIVVTGDPAAVEAIEVDGGVVRKRDNFNLRDQQLDILIRGVQLERVVLIGSVMLDLARLQKERFALCIQGSGSVDAFGQVRNLDIAVEGSGQANLDRLAIEEAEIVVNGSGSAYLGAVSRRANIRVNGSGNATVGPAENVNVNVTGTGSARLKSRPRYSNFQVTGRGGVLLVEPDGKITELARARRPADSWSDQQRVVPPRRPRY